MTWCLHKAVCASDIQAIYDAGRMRGKLGQYCAIVPSCIVDEPNIRKCGGRRWHFALLLIATSLFRHTQLRMCAEFTTCDQHPIQTWHIMFWHWFVQVSLFCVSVTFYV